MAEAAYGALDDDLRTRELAAAVPGLAELVVSPVPGQVPDDAAALTPVPRLLAGWAWSAPWRRATCRRRCVRRWRILRTFARSAARRWAPSCWPPWRRLVPAQIARRFHNEAVAQTQRLRRTWYARAFSLAGHARCR
ncbi:hypothetical protein NKG05_27405 [Oerskovia sp. M15]